jgi:tetratricopeptide (TPR) repeat protein
MQRFCENCGAGLGNGVRFCEACGAPVNIPDNEDEKPASYWLDEGMRLDEALRYEDAVIAYSNALDADPDCFAALYNRGFDCILLSRYREARDDFSRYLVHVPDDAWALKHLAVACFELGETDNAQEYIKRAVSLDPRVME